MKILLSPSKTMNLKRPFPDLKSSTLLDERSSLDLFDRLKQLPEAALSKGMALSPKQLETTLPLYQEFDPAVTPRIPALYLYSGSVFKQLRLEEYRDSELAYVSTHLRILSAMYGLIHPFSPIWPYRLDYTMHLPGVDPQSVWTQKVLEVLAEEDVLVDLASREFTRMLDPLRDRIHSVVILDRVKGMEKTLSTNAKILRGQIADYLIRNRITDLSGLKAFQWGGYRYQADRSDERTSVFMKTE